MANEFPVANDRSSWPVTLFVVLVLSAPQVPIPTTNLSLRVEMLSVPLLLMMAIARLATSKKMPLHSTLAFIHVAFVSWLALWSLASAIVRPTQPIYWIGLFGLMLPVVSAMLVHVLGGSSIDWERSLIRGIFIGAIFNGLLAVGQTLDIASIATITENHYASQTRTNYENLTRHGSMYRGFGALGNPAPLGLLMAIAVSLALLRRHQESFPRLSVTALVVAVLGGVSSVSRTFYLTVVFGFLMAFAINYAEGRKRNGVVSGRRPRQFLGPLVVASSALLVAWLLEAALDIRSNTVGFRLPSNPSQLLSGRYHLAEATSAGESLIAFQDSILFGYGTTLDTFGPTTSMYLRLGLIFGLAGFAIFFGAVCFILSSHLKGPESGHCSTSFALVVLLGLIGGLGSGAFFAERLGVLLWLVLPFAAFRLPHESKAPGDRAVLRARGSIDAAVGR